MVYARYLVGGLKHGFYFSIWNFIIPTDEHIFFRGVGILPTSHNVFFLYRCAVVASHSSITRLTGRRTRRSGVAGLW